MSGVAPTHVVIAIDGPAGSGKSTVARQLAQRLGYQYVDSGAFYRAAGWLVQAQGVAVTDTAAVVRCLAQTPFSVTYAEGQCQLWVAGTCLTTALRSEAAGRTASLVATLPEVRALITAQLRHLGRSQHVVMEGRDIGTVVFPDARVKFFLDASLAVRGQRRARELQQAGQEMRPEHVVVAMAQRDQQDQGRATAPLVQAADAQRIDTTDLTVDEVVDTMLSEIQQVLGHDWEETKG